MLIPEGRVCVFCGKGIKSGDELGMFSIILNGQLEDANKSCYNKYKAEKSNIRIKIIYGDKN